jgi:hypothetical protein
MPESFVLKHSLCLATALAVLVSVMTSPIRPNGASSLSDPSHPRRDFDVPSKSGSNQRSPVPTNSRVIQVKALSSRNWDVLAAMRDFSSRRFTSDGPTAPSSGAPRSSSAFGLDRANYAPRC